MSYVTALGMFQIQMEPLFRFLLIRRWKFFKLQLIALSLIKFSDIPVNWPLR